MSAARDEQERLAPVIPLFGAGRRAADDEDPSDEATRSRARHPAGSGSGRARGLPDAPRPAPVGPGGTREDPAAEWDTTWRDLPGAESASPPGDEERLAEVHKALVRKIGGHQLSESEARHVARAHDLGPAATDTLIDEFLRLGYLDDRALAEQLARAGVERKGQGRRAIAQVLSRRGIPRDVAAAVLADLPDDDAERAQEFARQKAPSLRRLPHETALRRLAGQLARRGYPASVALTAAREALDDSADPQPGPDDA